MRALIKKSNTNSFMIKINSVKYEEFLGRGIGRIQIDTSNGLIFIWTSIEELEGIQVNFLRDGYFDFREYKTGLDYFEL